MRDNKDMAYSIDYRRRVIEFLEEGHSQEETSIIFKVGTTTIKNWLSLLSETGSLEKRPLDRKPRKFDTEKLNAYNEKNPDALLKDIAAEFNGSTTGAFYALEREKITLKKNDILQRTRRWRTGAVRARISGNTERNRRNIRRRERCTERNEPNSGQSQARGASISGNYRQAR